MKRLFAAMILLCVLCVPAFALSDAEYKRFMRNAQFREADENMTDSYKRCKAVLPKKDFEDVRKEQREWVKKYRDERAEEIMEEEGCSRLEAYTKATDERDYELNHYVQMYELHHYAEE